MSLYACIFAIVYSAISNGQILNITSGSENKGVDSNELSAPTTNELEGRNEFNQSVLQSRILAQLTDDKSSERKFLLGDDLTTNNTQNQTRFDDFKPSPPLETSYEYNKIPVKPGLSEPKSFGVSPAYPERSRNWDNQNSWEPNSWSATAPNKNQNAWFASETTTESSSNRMRFPVDYHAPYKFVNGQNDIHPTNYPSITTEGFTFNKKIEVPNKSQEFYAKESHPSGPMQKTFFDYNMFEKPPQYSYGGYNEEYVYPSNYGGHYSNAGYYDGVPHKEYSSGHTGHGVGGYYGSPWKKIIKFLAAIIPIGLFLSALTPTVITVQSSNDSRATSKYRNEEKMNEFSKRLTSSFKYFDKLKDDGCEDKVLCELLVSASLSKNAEEHIQTLLDNFVNQEDLKSKKDDLLRIFDAVKNQDCSPLFCASINNPT